MVLAFYGASGLGMEFAELAKEINQKQGRWKEMIFVDDDPQKDSACFVGLKVLPFMKALDAYGKNNLEFILSVGEPVVKDILYKKLKNEGCKLTNLIHPENNVPDSARLGEGLVVKKNSDIPPMSVIGNNVLIQSKVGTGHGVIIGDNVVLSTFVFVGGDTEIGRNTYVGPHSSVRNGIKIGQNSVIGMGSVVTKDIPDMAVAYGNPCAVKRINEKGRVFSK